MLIYVALSVDCCGQPFEGIFSTLEAAKARVEASGRPEAVEQWETSDDRAETPEVYPLKRWDYNHTPGEKWVESKPYDYRS